MLARLILCMALSVAPAAGADLRLIVSAQAGGSYDHVARLVARHLGRHLPDAPRVVVETMPGASGRIAASYLYNAAPRDGSVIGLIQQAIPMGQALGEPVQYDAARFNWIGSPVAVDDVLVVWRASGVRTIDDARRRDVVIGGTGTTGANYIYPKLANAFVGTRFKIVAGYHGGPAINLAMERGEVDGRGANPWSDWKATKPEWVREGKVIPILQMSRGKHPDLPAVPLLIDLAPDAAVRSLFELVGIVGEIGRPFLAPPHVPVERVRALRDAFRSTMADPTFLADAAMLHADVSPIVGDDLAALVRRVLNAPGKEIDLLKAALRR